ncbi:MAG TPA: hypothetical protein VN739_10910, partial [Nitrososphaerales archaeon]|nr:hypothetical protein [Nitrososphaerales archaeon]
MKKISAREITNATPTKKYFVVRSIDSIAKPNNCYVSLNSFHEKTHLDLDFSTQKDESSYPDCYDYSKA